MVKGILKIVFGIFCLLFASKLVPYTYELYQLGKSSQPWVEVEAQVETFKFHPNSVKSSRQSSGGQTENHHVDVVYRYHIEGIEYVGDRTGFGPYSKGQLIRPNRHGKAPIYVNPDNPADSVYIKGISKPNIGAMIFALGMGLLGVIFIGMGLKNMFRD